MSSSCFRDLSASLACCLALIPGAAWSQTLVVNDAILDSGVNKAIDRYTALIGGNARLYNGSQYREFEIHDYDTGHPYFHSDDWTTGTVDYDNQYGVGAYILYDLIQDKVIIENPYDNTKISLVSDKLDAFSMAGHHFVKLKGDSAAQLVVRPGFYDLLYDGQIKVYAKREKEIVLKIESGLEKKKFKDHDHYFIFKANHFYPVRSKSSVLHALSDRKASLRKQMAKNKVVFSKDLDISIPTVARLYDESENTP